MRLDRFLANSGFGSRTEVKEMIRQGIVRIDGHVCRDAGQSVTDGGSAVITLNEQSIIFKKQIHLMMNKPAGLITAMEDPRHRTIAELIPPRYKAAGLFPVGRLDIDATGLLLLTNDGTLCHRLASPRWEVWKTYDVTIQGKQFDETDVISFQAGLELADGLKCRPAQLAVLDQQRALLTIHEGKYHQVKRMMLATGRCVLTLHRISVGQLQLDQKLAPGECRELTALETAGLYQLVELAAD